MDLKSPMFGKVTWKSQSDSKNTFGKNVINRIKAVEPFFESGS